MKRKDEIWAIDFDDTLCTNNYPFIGEAIECNVSFVKKLKEEGARLILYTCRENHNGALDRAIEWSKEQGIIFDAVNDNLEDVVQRRGVNSRKISAHYFFDDRGINASDFAKGVIIN